MLNLLKLDLPIAALVLILAISTASAETIAGRASVIDGDKLEIHGQHIHILDVDALQSQQSCGKNFDGIVGIIWVCGREATFALSDSIGQETATCETTKKDRYKRWLAHCTVGDSGW